MQNTVKESSKIIYNIDFNSYTEVVYFCAFPIPPSPLCTDLRVHIYRSTGQRSMFQTSTFCRSTALYINRNLLKYRTKCHLKMPRPSTLLIHSLSYPSCVHVIVITSSSIYANLLALHLRAFFYNCDFSTSQCLKPIQFLVLSYIKLASNCFRRILYSSLLL